MDRAGRVSVHAVMLNWNSYDYNAACINSLKESSYPFTRIVVVDNGSTDGSIQRLEEEFKDPQMLFIRNAKNEGFAGGQNIGIRAAFDAGAEMVFSVNNDTVIDPGCLGLLVEALVRDPEAGIAGPAIMYFKNPEKVWQAGGYFNPVRAGVVVPGKGGTARDLPSEVRDVSFLTGCAILIRKRVFETVGMLDTSYFFYGEDLDFDLRVRAAGMRLLFVPRARLWHKIDEVATDRTSPYVLYHLARSTVMLFRRRFEIPYRWYGIALQFALYTPFRFWQILKGGSGWQACAAWLKGLTRGMTERLDG
jgi:GT2 family glycosyltransferase